MSKTSPKGPGGGQAPQQPSWLLAAIWALTAVLLFRTCSPSPSPNQSKPPTDLRALLIEQNSKLLEGSAKQTLQDYNSSLQNQENSFKQQKDKKQISEDELKADIADIRAKQAEANILYSDALLRAGLKSGNYNRFQDAFQSIYTLQQAQGQTDNWTKPVDLPANADGPARSITPEQLYEKAQKELSTANQHNLVWGFIPGYQIIDFLVHVTGAVPGFSYWFAALLLALLVRTAAWPFSQKQLMYSRQMQQLMPMVKEIQEKYKNDDAQKQTKTMELYGQYGINPFAGCLPLLVQLPFFFAIYQCMLQYRFDFQKGSFFWTTPQISAATHGFMAPNLGQPDNLIIILYAASMLTSTLLMPISDPSNAKQQRTIGIIAALIFPLMMLSRAYPLPCAFVLYWTFTNVFSTLQTLRAYRLAAPPLVKKTTVAGGVIAAPRKKGFMERLQEEMQNRYEQQMKAEEERKALAEGKTKEEPKPDFEPDLANKNGKPASNGKAKPKRRKPETSGPEGPGDK